MGITISQILASFDPCFYCQDSSLDIDSETTFL